MNLYYILINYDQPKIIPLYKYKPNLNLKQKLKFYLHMQLF